jgi:hypothetical protein
MNITHKTFRITGYIIDQKTRQTVPGLPVEVWDKDMIFNELVGSAVTDEQGVFQITFSESYFREIFRDRRPDLFFKVFHEEKLIKSTEDSVLRNVDNFDMPVVIEVEILDAKPQPGELFIVQGQIHYPDGKPFISGLVKAFDKDLRSEEILGETISDKMGYYKITYRADQFRRKERKSVDLLIRAYLEGKEPTESPVVFNAQPVETVDLVIGGGEYRGPSEFERIGEELTPLLDGVTFAELREDGEIRDIAFLSGETDLPSDKLFRFTAAHRLTEESHIEPEFWYALLVTPFYPASNDQNLPDLLAVVRGALPYLDVTAVRKALTGALSQNLIPFWGKDKLDAWIKAFLDFVARQTVSGDDAILKGVLEDAGIRDARRQEKFARLFGDYRGLTRDLVEALNQDGSFEHSEIADLQTTFQIADLAQGNFSVARVSKMAFGIREPGQVRRLAKASEEEWITLVREHVASGDLQLPVDIPLPDLPIKTDLRPAEAYGKTLAQQFREAFPTVAFTGGLERAMGNGGSKGLKRPELVGNFLDGHEQFEFLTTSIDDFFETKLRSDIGGLARNEELRLELKGIQRVFKLAPNFEATDELLADDLHSASKIYRMGETEFVRAYADRPGFTLETARRTWNRAAETQAAVLTLVGELQALDAEGLPLALLNGNEAVAKFPNWNNLFKTGDLCECEHCRSVFSPAAYFADLLMFLKERKAKNPAQTVKDILFQRRPDLGYLELNCENANTPLPYIDVVCEVLENVIAADENDLELSGLTTIPDASAATKANVATAFAAQGVSLGDDFTLSQVKSTDPNLWIAHGDAITYLLKKKATLNFFAEILRNTKASAAELRANPQYVNPKAYEKLKTARYPFALPFDLFNEEVRAAFQKVAVKRWQLMRTFKGHTAPNKLTEAHIAVEYFGISVAVEDTAPPSEKDDKRIILTADVANQHEYWGESAASLVANVSKVDVFLQKTGLEYQQLLALLDLKFINPMGDIAVVHLNPTCDTEQKRIQILDASKLDRIHRFIRLWRKLGWKMWELDLVIHHPAIGNGNLDETFLVNLMYFTEVKYKLGSKVTVEQTAALFGNLNTVMRFTKLHEKQEDALYQNLFLNKKLIHPLDENFQIDPATDDLNPKINPDTGLPFTLTDRQPIVQAALGVRDADFQVFKNLTKPSGSPYVNDDLNLANLSFLWRQAWLAKLLKFKADEWRILLKLLNEDIAAFSSPQAAWDLLEKAGQLKNTGFNMDELNWLLSADRSAKAAVKETDAAKFLFELRKSLQAVRDEYDASKYAFLTAMPPTDEEQLAELLTTLQQQLNRDETAVNFFLATLRGDVSVETKVAGLGALVFPDGMPIKYDVTAEILRFSGVMTGDQQNTLNGLDADPAYRAAIKELFDRPRLAVKFYEPVFTAPLEFLPPTIDFKIQLSPDLAAKISYDAEQRLLRFSGIMSKEEQATLDALVPNVTPIDIAYHNAINSLATLPQSIVPPDERIWLTDNDLDTTLPANNTFAKRLANATTKAFAHLSKTFAKNAVVQQGSEALGLTPAVAREIMTRFELIAPDTILEFFTGAFSTTSGAIDYTGFKNAFDTWYWLNRISTILKKWKVNLEEFGAIIALQTPAQLLDFRTLPIDDNAPVASIDTFLRTNRLFKLRDTLPETSITLLEILERLNSGNYANTDFAADVQLVNDAWNADDVKRLTETLDLTYPDDYLLAENWERLHNAFRFLEKLNAGADKAIIFANPIVGEVESDTLKQLLRSKFGSDSWLTLSTEIQDVLRERKRDALVAWLLHQFKPTTPPPPSGKWENTNDVYGYYLLDVEMSACQLTSRLVQASGSVQLFVQRCHMGLEPDVLVQADGDDGDSAWRWWKWMKKYRVWEANRKVFLYPENWIEPELRRDKSPFFKDLENELLQNEVNQYTVESAFLNYLEKLDGVAQLEIAGFYQEDDADRTVLHVFGRTQGGEPRIYYYRQYDYRRWTPWEKVDLDIAGDYLIPAVVNKRLFLFWPVFTEVPDETENNKPVPIPQSGATEAPVKRATKRLRLQMAVSDYRQGKWSPKKISKDFYQSGWITEVDIVRKFYHFIPVDRSNIDGRFIINFGGYSLGSDGYEQAELHGAFEITGCKGVPELTAAMGTYTPALQPEWASVGQYNNPPKSYTAFMKWIELGTPDEFGRTVSRHDAPQNDFTLFNSFTYVLQTSGITNTPNAIMVPREWSGYATPILIQTPNTFKMSPPWHLSYLDKFWLDSIDFSMLASNPASLRSRSRFHFSGSWLPFFYADKKRTFFVLPSLKWRTADVDTIHGGATAVRLYYPEVKKIFRQLQDGFDGQVKTVVNGIDLSALTPDQRKQLEEGLRLQFPEEEEQPRYTDKKVLELLRRFLMRYFNYWLGYWSYYLFLSRQFHFKNFYHPFVCDFAKLVNNPLKGIPALMSRDTQLKDSGFRFFDIYQPTQWVVEPTGDPNNPYSELYPKEDVDFTPDGAYSPYNWELLFHAPLMIANQLSKNQRFEEAMQWYHFIFNPLGLEGTLPNGTIAGAPQKYWITKPFFLTTDDEYLKQRIDGILRMLAGDTTVPGFTAQLKKDLEDQVRDWRDNPFEPHRIAQYRTVAYQKTTVMKYLDNLIAWGDYLFRQDSMESINEATQLYVLAAEILGPRPRKIPTQAKPPLESFNELEEQFDRFSNALVQIENLVPSMPGDGQNGDDTAPLPMLYFCIPQNDKLLGYWDTVADRLYKIRHCMNIEGVVRQLALFEPPIEPGALVKAIAAGVDINSALADLNTPLPLYRFNVLLQKANEVCNDVKALGSALLSALEKKDAEALGLLRQSQEIRLLEAVKAVREQQIEEVRENLEGVKKSKELAQIRKQYYESREFMNKGEITATALNFLSMASHTAGTLADTLAGAMFLIPDFRIGGSGFGGSPHFTSVPPTGDKPAKASERAANGLYNIATILDKNAGLAATLASYQRRQEEWDFQQDLAAKETEQIDKQIAAAELRIAIAEKELENHVIQIENAKATDEFMRSKYTNEELFQWQVGQISGVFFQSYKLAYDLAKRAERCFRFELGLQDSNYIQFGYWDSLKKGLLSGDKLQYDLRRLENAYLEQNRREFELTKHVSLALAAPLALVQLKETGRCIFRLPEEIFDLDYPGHYFRRIKSVSITLPCVTGPYTTTSCTLRLLKNYIRINSELTDGYAHAQDDDGMWTDDPRFVESNIPVKAIATSNAQNDSGIFELSFRDERYLPFEGAGAVSEWALELFSDLPANNPNPANPDFGKPLRQFDYDTITDAVIHIKYMAREDAGAYKNAAIQHLREYFEQEDAVPSLRLFNLRQEFPTQWHRFLHPANPVDGNVFELDMSPNLFPFKDNGKILNVNSILLLARCSNGDNYSVVLNPPLPAPPPTGSDKFELVANSLYGGLHFAKKPANNDTTLSSVTIDPLNSPTKWQLKMTGPAPDGVLGDNEVEDIFLVVGYEWEAP